MSKKLLATYEEALERIRDLGPLADIAAAIKIAVDTLAEGEKDSEQEKAVLLGSLRDFIMAHGLIFDTVEEIAEKLNEDGSILTLRGKPWTRASVARLMPEIRVAILAATAALKAAPVVAPATEEPEEAVQRPETIVVDEVIRPAAPSPIEEQIREELELDELEELEGMLTAS